MNQDLILAAALPVTLFCIMFSMGVSLKPRDFKRVLHSSNSVMTGIASQMLLLPLLAYLLLSLLNPPVEIFIGFMILALSPGGTTSNLLSYLAGGNLALSISLTAVVSVVTPVSIPLVAGWILSSEMGQATSIQLPFLPTLAKLVVVTLIPVILGMLLRYYKPVLCLRFERWIITVPIVMLLWVISGIIHQNWERMPFFLEQTGLAALMLSTLALLTGYVFARMMKRSESDARTIAVETSIQNGGTAILVTGSILQNPAMTIAPVMYGILMLVPVSLYLLMLKRQQPAFAE